MRITKRNAFILLCSAVLSGKTFAADQEPIQSAFQVKDIRVEGLQRIEAGTVFNYLPIKVGEQLTPEKSIGAIKALYATGFFKDVELERDGQILVVNVQERPAIAQLTINGMKEFSPKQIKDALKQIGIAESRTFDRSMLEKAEQEIKRQYFNLGKYGLKIQTVITPLERNRVAVTFNVNEGEAARIKGIQFIGNKSFKDADLLEMMTLDISGWLSWFSKDDQYSKQKFSADLEALRSFYLNQGFLEFRIDSTQVTLSPDKKEIYLTVNMTEGDRYTVSDYKFAGEMLLPEETLRKSVKIKPNELFSREKLTESTKEIGELLGNEGYAFANVNAIPEIDKEKRKVSFTFFVDPGRKVYVRRINIAGNTKTRDQVIRREVRQMESAWYAGDKINRSRERINRLGFFSDVTVETPAVANTLDQVDVNFNVTEKPTGNMMIGAGVSSTDKFVVTGSITQNNVFGTGNYLSAQVNSGKINKVYALSFTDPYFTIDGISRGFDIYKRNLDSTSLTIGQYRSSTMGAGVRFGVPLNEIDTINFGLAYENTTLDITENSPSRYIDFVNKFGNSNRTILATLGWARDSRDSILFPTKGNLYRVYGEAGLPGGSLKFYKLSYQQQWFQPISQRVTFMINGEAGLAGGYGNKPLPFFKNFFLGGVTSLRGYDTGTVGPKDTNGDALGGTRRFLVNAELLFPFPGLEKDKSVRMGAFVDAGAIIGQGEKFDAGNIRYSTGLSINWFSPVGPMRFSIAKPIHAQPDDKKQTFQFMLGTVF